MEVSALLLAAVCPYGHEELRAMDKEAFLDGLADDKYFEEDSGQPLPVEEVRAGVDRELELMTSFPVFEAVRRSSATSRVWSTRWCHRRKGPTTVRSRFVVRQYVDRDEVSFYSPTPGHETFRVLLILALRENLTVRCGDISVAFMNTPMPEDTPVFVEPPKGLCPDRSVVWRLRRALNGLRDAARLFLEYLTKVLVEQLGFVSTSPQPTLFVRSKGRLFVTIHVDDLMAVGPEAIIISFMSWIRKHFTVKFAEALGASPVAYVGARFWRGHNGIVEDAAEGYIQGMIEDAGLRGAKSVTTPIVDRDDMEDATPPLSPEAHRLYRRIVGKAQHLTRRPKIAYAVNALTRQLQARPRPTGAARRGSCNTCWG